MDFDFNLILVPLTVVLGIVWLLDKLALKQRKTRGRGQEGLLVRWAYDFFPVLAVVLIVRSFLLPTIFCSVHFSIKLCPIILQGAVSIHLDTLSGKSRVYKFQGFTSIR